jgi:hypothetical protein
MAAIVKSEEINHDRRRFVETAAIGIAAAGTAGLIPEHVAAAIQDNAIRPFRVNRQRDLCGDWQAPAQDARR